MSKNVTSYVTYTTTGGIGGVVNSNASETTKVVKEAGEQILETSQESSWIAEKFPELVADGTVKVVNGTILVDGISLTEILSLFVVIISLLFLVIKGIADLKNIVDRFRINSKQENFIDKQIENLGSDEVQTEKTES